MSKFTDKKPRGGQKVDFQNRPDVPQVPRNAAMVFLDSGAHSLYSEWVLKVRHKFGYTKYESPEFWTYCDQYAGFLKAHPKSIDWYANVDVIFNPELSWKAQRYLEDEHGLKPVPVVHYGTPLKWVDRYLRAGYKYLGVGGLGQEATRGDYLKWADRLFSHLCPAPTHLPVVRCHGFAMTSYRLMIRYPWYSVDSASWAQLAGYGGIFVPHYRAGRFVFDENPYPVFVSNDSRFRKMAGRHFDTFTKEEQATIVRWVESLGMVMGEVDANGDARVFGMVGDYGARAIANMIFFQKMAASRPKWPWAFKAQVRRGFKDRG